MCSELNDDDVFDPGMPMRFPFLQMTRLIVASGILLTAIAVVIGKHQTTLPDQRTMAPSRYHPISDHLFQEMEPGVRVLDSQTGTLERMRLPGADRIEYAACSPWRDRLGRTQLIGLWKDIDGGNIRAMGIARYSLPEGEVLDRVEMETIPGSPLCWFPGTSSRILFAGWDGRLYQFSFEKPDEAQGPFRNDPPEPRPLEWRAPLLNGGRILLADPCWPSDPRLGGKVIVSISFVEETGDESLRTRTQLWWLRLSADGSSIEEAGRLIEPEPSDHDHPIIEERLGNIAATPEGDLVLGYLIRRSGSLVLQFRLAPVLVDGATGTPRVDESDMVELAGGCSSSPPVFTEDGRWVYIVPRARHAPSHATRFSVVEALASRPGTLAHVRDSLAPSPAERTGRPLPSRAALSSSIEAPKAAGPRGARQRPGSPIASPRPRTSKS